MDEKLWKYFQLKSSSLILIVDIINNPDND